MPDDDNSVEPLTEERFLIEESHKKIGKLADLHDAEANIDTYGDGVSVRLTRGDFEALAAAHEWGRGVVEAVGAEPGVDDVSVGAATASSPPFEKPEDDGDEAEDGEPTIEAHVRVGLTNVGSE